MVNGRAWSAEEQTMQTIANTQIGPDGKRHPIGSPELAHPEGVPQAVFPEDDVPGDLPPGVIANPDVSAAELARLSSGQPTIAEAETEAAEEGEEDEASEEAPAEPEAPAAQPENPASPPPAEPEFDIEKATKAELIAEAEKQKVEVHTSKLLEEIRQELKDGLAAKAASSD